MTFEQRPEAGEVHGNLEEKHSGRENGEYKRALRQAWARAVCGTERWAVRLEHSDERGEKQPESHRGPGGRRQAM